MARCFLARLADLQTIPAINKTFLQSFQEAQQLGPTHFALCSGLYAVMAAEILLRSRDNPAELVKSIQGFHRFAASTLAIAKKDAPQMFATRLDKLQKDCAV